MKITIEGTEKEIKNILQAVGNSEEYKEIFVDTKQVMDIMNYSNHDSVQADQVK